VYTAAQNVDIRGDVYAASGYTTINGTSFSAPITAGMIAALKAARPGLSPSDYRSLLVNSARSINSDTSFKLPQVSAGLADLNRALDAPLRFAPVSVTFTSKDQVIDIRAVNSSTAKYFVSVEPKDGTAPQLSVVELEVSSGSTAQLGLSLDLPAVNPGTHSGYVVFQAEGTTAMRVPYFFGKSNDAAAAEIQVLLQPTASVRAGTPQQDLLIFRILDSNGIAIEKAPSVRVLSGSAQLREVQNRDFDVAGSFGIDVVLGLGSNVLEVDAGNGIRRQFTILGR
jgi:hypothetical protein